MGVTIHQDNVGSFPDRPVGGGSGLRALATTGDGGAYVTMDVGAELSIMHMRCMVNVAGLTGGRAVLMVGTDGDNAESFRLTWNAASGQFNLSAGGGTLSCMAIVGLTWHCLEWRIDTVAGAAQLWRNGIEVNAASVGGLASTRYVHAGLMMKDVACVGEAMLDEWVIADEYVGVVRVDPSTDHANDPARWLVVYNRDVADSVAWVKHYRQSRAVPYANLCGLSLSSAETISAAACEELVDTVEQYVTLNGLAEQIMGVLLGHGVPGMYTRSDSATASVTDALQRRDGGETEAVNQLLTTDGLHRPTVDLLNGDWITARIDGPTLAHSIALVDRATTIAQAQPIDPLTSQLWIDLASGGGIYTAFENLLRNWAEGLQRQATRLPMTTSDDAGTGGHIAMIQDDGFFWGFVASVPPQGFFGSPAGTRLLVNPMTYTTLTLATLRNASDDGWARTAIDAGYAAAVGTVRLITPSAFADVARCFEALRLGWSLGEAWHDASPLLRAGVVLIGDPLMTVNLPRAGWNVYGPFESCADVCWGTPLAMLRDDERSHVLPAEVRPDADHTALFIVTRVDAQGRELRALNAAALEGSS